MQFISLRTPRGEKARQVESHESSLEGRATVPPAGPNSWRRFLVQAIICGGRAVRETAGRASQWARLAGCPYRRNVTTCQVPGDSCPQCAQADLRPYGNGSKWICSRCFFVLPCCEGGELPAPAHRPGHAS